MVDIYICILVKIILWVYLGFVALKDISICTKISQVKDRFLQKTCISEFANLNKYECDRRK